MTENDSKGSSCSLFLWQEWYVPTYMCLLVDVGGGMHQSLKESPFSTVLIFCEQLAFSLGAKDEFGKDRYSDGG